MIYNVYLLFKFCPSMSEIYTFIIFLFLLIFFYKTLKKHWFRKNFQLAKFDGYSSFCMSRMIDYFWKMSVTQCVRDKNLFFMCSSRTNSQNWMKFHPQFYPKIQWRLSNFRENQSKSYDAVTLFPDALG